MQCNVPPQNEQELLIRAQQLTGKTFLDLFQEYYSAQFPNSGQLYSIDNLEQEILKNEASLLRAKGYIGQLIEWKLGAPSHNLPQADFVQLGIELKTLPVNKQGFPKESTFICSANVQKGKMETRFQDSLVWQKLSRVLWIPVEADTDIAFANRKIGCPILWSPNKDTQIILEQDWQELTELLIFGKIDEFSAKVGTYLQLRPKAMNSSVVQKILSDHGEINWMVPKGFYLRKSFTIKIMQKNGQV